MNVWRSKVDGIVFVSRASRLAMSSSVKASARPPTAVAEQFPKRAPLSAISPNKAVDRLRGNPEKRVLHDDLVGAEATFESLDDVLGKEALYFLP